MAELVAVISTASLYLICFIANEIRLKIHITCTKIIYSYEILLNVYSKVANNVSKTLQET